MKINKAIITCAGFGTRLLPITKTIQKEMLPFLNRPIIDYLVEDCIKAGIKEIVFVINSHNYQILHFYRENQRLYEYLKKVNKAHLYQEIEHLHQEAQFHFVKQDDSELYGTATPVKLAKKYVENEDAFLVLMGDDFLYNADGSSEIKRMIDLFKKSEAQGLVTCIKKQKEELHRYGIAQIAKQNGNSYLKKLVEKPAPGKAPSDLANISKYIFTPKIFEVIDHQQLDQENKELQITDTISQVALTQPVVIHQPKGEYLDGGNLSSWLKANIILAKNREDLWPDLASWLKTQVK